MRSLERGGRARAALTGEEGEVDPADSSEDVVFPVVESFSGSCAPEVTTGRWTKWEEEGESGRSGEEAR